MFLFYSFLKYGFLETKNVCCCGQDPKDSCQQKVKPLVALSCFMQNAVVTDGVGNVMLVEKGFPP